MDIQRSVHNAMRQTNEVFCSEVIRQQDFQDLDRVYTEDARLLPPGAKMARGRADVLTFWRTTITTLGIKSAALATLEAEMVGNCVIEIGQAESIVAAQQLLTAKYVIQWKEERGR